MAKVRGLGSVAGIALCVGCIMPPAPPMVVPQPSPEPLQIAAPIEKHVLENGLVVILNEDRRVPVVAVRVTYQTGSASDPPGRAGMAHLLEHLLFSGTRHVPRDGHFTLLEAAGADVNASTSPDWTSYYEVVPAGSLPLALWLESERMAFGLERVDEALLARERRIVALEEQERLEGAPNGKLRRFIGAELYPEGHPYAPRQELGLGTVTIADLRAFYQAHYGPNNAVLVVSGHFDPAPTLRLIKHYFARASRRATASLAPTPTVSLNETRSIQIEARVERPLVSMFWPTPPYFSAGDADLDVIASHLEGKLRELLIDERGVAVSVGVVQSSAKLLSTFQIWVSLKPETPPAEIVTQIDEVLRELRRTGMQQQDIRDCAFDLLMDLYLEHDDVGGRSLLLTEHELAAGNPRFLQLATKRYEGVDQSSVKETLGKYLPVNRKVVTIVTPTPSAPVAGRLRGQP